MSAVAALVPPRPFRAPRRARGWAIGSCIAVALVASLTVFKASRSPLEVLALIGPFFCGCVALLGVLTRSAQLRVDADGITWGWGEMVIRMRRPDLRAARVYAGGETVALVPKLGFTWHLAGRDWERFQEMPGVLRHAGLPVEEIPSAAPLLSRLQGYGIALDLLLAANLGLAMFVFLVT